MIESFDDITIRNISDFCSNILTHKIITEKLKSCRIVDMHPSGSKTDRVYHSLIEKQKLDSCGNNVIAFLQNIVTPRRYSDEAEFEQDRELINEKLVYVGIEIGKDG